jgi:hypothetical protein
MGHACIGYDIWVADTSWPYGYYGWTFVLLLCSVASTSHWKELHEDSKMGVSLHASVAKALSFNLQTYIKLCVLTTLFSNIYCCVSLTSCTCRHWIVDRFKLGVQANSPVRPATASTGTGAFRGRSYRLNQD